MTTTTTEDRWYVTGPLGVGTAFDETTDAQTATLSPWAGVGSAIRHSNKDTLNVLDGRVAAVDQGPALNFWGLNVAGKAVRLGEISARFAATTDGGATGYLSFQTKPATGDVSEALRITPTGGVGIGTSTPAERLQVSGGGAIINGISIGALAPPMNYQYQYESIGVADPHMNLRLQSPNWILCHTAGAPRLTIDASGNVNITPGALSVAGNFTASSNLSVAGSASVAGSLGLGTTSPLSRLHIAGGDLRLDGGHQIYAAGRLHISGDEILFLLNHSGVIIGKEWGGTGDLTVEGHLKGDVTIEGKLGLLGQSPVPRTPGWAGGIHTWDLEVEGSAWCRNGWASGARDMAENFVADVPLEPGEVVAFDLGSDGVVRSSRPDDVLVCGVVSTTPGVLLNFEPETHGHDGRVPVALCGRVPCKVVDENGPIQRGDLLTSSSVPGHAMRAEPMLVAGERVYRSGTIIGKALAAHSSGAGVIDVFVAPS
jgi:hypothetical protein